MRHLYRLHYNSCFYNKMRYTVKIRACTVMLCAVSSTDHQKKCAKSPRFFGSSALLPALKSVQNRCENFRDSQNEKSTWKTYHRGVSKKSGSKIYKNKFWNFKSFFRVRGYEKNLQSKISENARGRNLFLRKKSANFPNKKIFHKCANFKSLPTEKVDRLSFNHLICQESCQPFLQAPGNSLQCQLRNSDNDLLHYKKSCLLLPNRNILPLLLEFCGTISCM